MEIESNKTRDVVTISVLAGLLAALFDYLFFGKFIGLSVFIFVAALLGVAYGLASKNDYKFRSSLWLVAPILFFAAMPAVRADEFLNFLNIVAVLGLLLLLTRELLLEQIRKFHILDYVVTIIGLPLRFFISFFKPIRYIVGRFSQHSTGWKRVVTGVVIALPVLIVFTLLFSSADLAFKQFVDSIVSFNISDNVIQHLILLFIVFVAVLGAFEYTFKATSDHTGQRILDIKETKGREVETAVFLSLIASLFIIFITFQLTYLFGGEVDITNRGFTYAEYARRGFWELLAVALGTLVILVFTDKSTYRNESRRNWFTIPSMIIIVEILIIIISAFKRLMLYVDTYGMTELRFYVTGFIIFLGVIFLLLAIKFLKEKRESFFTFGSLITMIVFLVGVNIINPDAFIAKSNFERFHQTGKIDVLYFGALSSDALPVIMSELPNLSAEDQSALRHVIAPGITWEIKENSWQSFNLARHKAKQLWK